MNVFLFFPCSNSITSCISAPPTVSYEHLVHTNRVTAGAGNTVRNEGDGLSWEMISEIKEWKSYVIRAHGDAIRNSAASDYSVKIAFGDAVNN